MGVISLQGGAQAKEIESELLTRVDPEIWQSRQLRCGDSADFQGSERNVIFLSMVATVEPERRLTALTADQYVQRYNVAASRAKDQMWVFHSIPVSELKNPEDMRFQLLDYCYGAAGRLASDDEVLKEAVPDDVVVSPFDSLFEQRVYNRLFDRGYSVIPQFPAEGYSIDLVVVGASRRLAIECDGDHWHGPDAYQNDLARQRELERCGWTFHRIRESAFYLDEASALAELWEALDESDIRPSGWVDERPHASKGLAPGEGRVAEEAAELHTEESAAAESIDPVPGFDSHDEHDAGEDDSHGDEYPDLTEYEETGIQWLWRNDSDERLAQANGLPPNEHELSVPRDVQGVIAPRADSGLKPYRTFSDEVVHPDRATKSDLVDGLVRIVAVEGPVLGARLQTAYLRAAGGQRVGRNVARELNSAIYAAVRRGRIIQSDPLGRQGLKFRTYRLPDQPGVLVRELGPRGIEQVPPDELAVVMKDEAQVCGWNDQRALYKAVLTRFGLMRLTRNVEAVLDLASELLAMESVPVPIAPDPVENWAASLFQSSQYAEQKVRAGRGSVDDAIVEGVLIALVRLGGRGSFELIEEEAGLTAGSLRDLLPGLRRLLNLEGYEVLTVGDDGVLTVDPSMLSAQFGMTELARAGSA